MKLVSEKDLPKLADIIDVPLDNPIKVLKICLEMQILCDKEQGIGLSAVQVGIPWKLFIIKNKSGNFDYYINCEYEPTDDCKTVVSLEGCLSLRSPEGHLRHFEVERFQHIRLHGKKLILTTTCFFEDFDLFVDLESLSIVFQHEIDHQKEILISDRGKEIFLW